MSFKYLFLIAFTCVSLTLSGCESQRYKPADWKSDNSTLTDRGGVAVVSPKDKKNLKRPQSPTNWMELSGTGGELAGSRRYNGTLPYRGGTLPYRGGTMPYRGGTMPYRGGTMPYRGGGNTSLPERQYRWDANVNGTTIPARNAVGTLPRR